MSLTGRPLGAIVEDDAPPEAWRYRGLGDGVVADDEGVAMAAGRVARRVVVVADVVTGVQVDVEDEEEPHAVVVEATLAVLVKHQR